MSLNELNLQTTGSFTVRFELIYVLAAFSSQFKSLGLLVITSAHRSLILLVRFA